jgi:predicted Rossmann fold nucleotide-binding protein DprA/Smf involved in DNA uptake
MRVAIVGSRDFANLSLVESYVSKLAPGTIVVSGGAEGVDETAARAARKQGMEVLECTPDTKGCKQRFEFTKRFYERNQKIVDNADAVVAFTDKDKGGTWDTIKRAKKKKLPVTVIRSNGNEEPC